MVMIREIRESNAEEFLNLCKNIDAETQFMMFEPGERPTTIEEQRKGIKDILSKDNQTILVAEKDNQLTYWIFGGIWWKM